MEKQKGGDAQINNVPIGYIQVKKNETTLHITAILAIYKNATKQRNIRNMVAGRFYMKGYRSTNKQ